MPHGQNGSQLNYGQNKVTWTHQGSFGIMRAGALVQGPFQLSYSTPPLAGSTSSSSTPPEQASSHVGEVSASRYRFAFGSSSFAGPGSGMVVWSACSRPWLETAGAQGRRYSLNNDYYTTGKS